MANYQIFTEEGGRRIAINPERVVSIMEISPRRVTINLPNTDTVIIPTSLENVVAQLRGARIASEHE